MGIGTVSPGARLDVQSTSTATTGSVIVSKIAPTYNQTAASTANTDLLINRTETAIGSGQQNLIDTQVGGVSKFRVDNAGVIYGNGSGITGVSASTIPFSGLRAATIANTIDNLNFSQTWNFSTAATENPLSISANALTTGSLLNLTSSSATLNSTNGLLNVANTSAATTGMVARIQSNSTAGSGMTVLANGNVGVGTNAPGTTLDIGGISTFRNDINVGRTLETPKSINFYAEAGELVTLKATNTLIASETGLVTNRLKLTSGRFDFDPADSKAEFRVSGNTTQFNIFNTGLQQHYLQMSTDGSNISRIVFPNGSVGVGVPVPTAALQIKAGTAVANTAPLKLTSGVVLTAPEAGAVEYDGTNLFFTDGTAARRTIATTTNLASYLSLAGGTMTGAAISSAGSAAAPSVGVGQTTSGLFSGGTNILGLSTAGVERMRIDAAGNVGIGTTLPTDNLHIHTTGSFSTLRLTNSATGSGTLNDGFAISVNSVGAGSPSLWNYENSALRIGTNNIERVRVDQNGNVGIGTTSPGAPLDVQTTNTTTSGSVVAAKVAPTYNQAAATTANTDLLINRTETAIGSGQQNLIDAQVGGVSKFRVDNAGVIYGSGAGITGVSASTIPLSGLRAAGATNTFDNLNFAQTWNFSTATTQIPLSISANALTTGSLLNLSTSSTILNSANGLLNVANTNTSATGILARFQSNSTSNSGMTILANGKVGVGTVTPPEAMTVIGKLLVGPDQNTTTGATLQIQDETAGLPWLSFNNAPMGGSIGMSSAALQIAIDNGDIEFKTGTAYNQHPSLAGNIRMVVKPSGDVGIGTTTPTALLQIKAGTAAANTAPMKFTSGVNLTAPEAGAVEYDGPNLYFTDSTSVRRTIATTTNLASYLSLAGGTMTGAAISSAGSAAAPSVGVGQTTSGLFSGGTNILGLSTAGVERIRVDASGNVGIGNATTGVILDVKGHFANSGNAATVGTCGATPAITGNDTRGAVTVGTGSITSCVVTFNSAFITAPFCTITWRGAASTIGIGVTATTTALTINFSAAADGLSVNYSCMQ